jgi:hypothetical protein
MCAKGDLEAFSTSTPLMRRPKFSVPDGSCIGELDECHLSASVAIHASAIPDSIPHNPFIPTPTRSVSESPVGQLPLVFNGVGSDFDWQQIKDNLTLTRPWVILLDDSQTGKFEELTSLSPLTTIPKDNITLWSRSFWEGRTGLFPDTVDTPITVFTSPMITSIQRTMIQDTIFMRSMKGGK